jgi:hypothetical protein
MTNPPTDENERVARAICEALGHDPDGCNLDLAMQVWAKPVPHGWTNAMLFRTAAKVAIAAMDTRRENEVLREALKPFADYADPHGRFPPNLSITVGSDIAKRQLTMGDCYKARAALTNTPDKEEDNGMAK